MLDSVRRFARQAVSLVGNVLSPEVPGRREVLQRAWDSLPPFLQRPDQVFGLQLAGCGATYNVLERCNFSCTACYLADTANAVPPLPFEEVKQQLDAIRAHLGPWGNAQITAGEVTLMPVEDLIRIVRYCNEIELSAMVMTHGDTFRKDPTYLERLVTEGGLEKVAIHVDTTQRGRQGMKKGDREADLHWIRDELADIVRETRRKTGRPLAAALTYTVTQDNLDEVADVVRWVVDNSDAFRMISFQPTAAVGRTRTGALAGRDPMRRRLWEGVREGTQKPLYENQYLFGHPRCTSIALAFVVKWAGRTEVVEVVRDAAVDKRFIQTLFGGAFGGFSPDGLELPEAVARLAGRILREPSLFARVPAFCAYRAVIERAWFPSFLKTVLTGGEWSVRPFAFVVHHFMSSSDLETPEGRERLDACVFKLPVDGEMVAMCTMNGTDLRARLNRSATERLRPAKPLPVSEAVAVSTSAVES